MLLVVVMMERNDSPTFDLFRMHILLLISSFLAPQQAIRDLTRHIIAVSSLCQLVLEFLQEEAKKGGAALCHNPSVAVVIASWSFKSFVKKRSSR
jgi:hypothetical protein